MRPLPHERPPRIEPLGPEHSMALHRLAQAPGLADVLFDGPAPTYDDVWRAIESAEELRTNGRGDVFAVLLGEELIGVCRLDRDSPWLAAAEVGYCIDEPFRGRGLATAAVGLVVEQAFAALGVELVTARCLRTHLPSRRVLEKLGFVTTHGAEETPAPFIGFELSKRDASRPRLTSTASRTSSSGPK
ncbi:GNAT family N-acetyltransferase [Stigmatella sp. ncwal1]|uniref:GNAT family N-acetyltransferase n=1 Tax=Stigmatella ashevillensis TaxID=2995309 RepID=A0ABT5DAG0_9BACT|nr:GNAT family N-acetyltransferase [Stigmatella ashevillena]MDC0710639.1 GNAT family N-acetyltransferase [Stigmatella ashevillena]